MGNMKGPAESESEMEKDLFLLMPYVLLVLLMVWVITSSAVSRWLFSIITRLLETERRRIQFKEKEKIYEKKAMIEGKTLQWLNMGLKVMWPICMEKFASQHFKAMASWFLNKYKPEFEEEVMLLSLHLGSTPLDFSLICALPPSQASDEVEKLLTFFNLQIEMLFSHLCRG